MQLTGKVKKLNPTFGFLRGDDGDEFFFLPTALQKSCGVEFSQLSVGQRVQFTAIEHPKGMRAIEIMVLGA